MSFLLPSFYLFIVENILFYLKYFFYKKNTQLSIVKNGL